MNKPEPPLSFKVIGYAVAILILVPTALAASLLSACVVQVLWRGFLLPHGYAVPPFQVVCGVMMIIAYAKGRKVKEENHKGEDRFWYIAKEFTTVPIFYLCYSAALLATISWLGWQ